MARVYIIEYPNQQVSKHWIKHLKEKHDVVVDLYFNPIYALWADVIVCVWCEGAAQELSQIKGHYEDVLDDAGVRGIPHARYSGDFDLTDKKIFIRPIDIDVWAGHFRGVKWQNVTGMLYTAPNFLKLMQTGFDFPVTLQMHEVPISIKMDEWHYRDRKPDEGYDIAWVNHSWTAKGLDFALQAFALLVKYEEEKPWHLHVCEHGRSNEAWYHGFIQHFIDANDLRDRVTFYDSVPSVDEFLEDKQYLWSTSMKESFSQISAEAMAKGLRVFIRNFPDAKHIWGDEITFDTVDQLMTMTSQQGNTSKWYRDLVSKYDCALEIQQLDEITGL